MWERDRERERPTARYTVPSRTYFCFSLGRTVAKMRCVCVCVFCAFFSLFSRHFVRIVSLFFVCVASQDMWITNVNKTNYYYDNNEYILCESSWTIQIGAWLLSHVRSLLNGYCLSTRMSVWGRLKTTEKLQYYRYIEKNELSFVGLWASQHLGLVWK